jgi:hypothetical protein
MCSEGDEMGWACGTYWGEEKRVRVGFDGET